MATERRQAALRAAAWSLALIYVWWMLRWSVRPEHYFFADDWDWLYRAVLLTWQEQTSVLPRWAFNDRPVGALIFRGMYHVFGLNPLPFHWLCLLLHLLNMTLLLRLTRRLLNSWWVSAAGALAYGVWSAANMGVSWMADIFDVFGETMILLCLLSFLSPRRGLRALTPLLYFLAARTKEATIGLPAVLLVWLLVEHGWHAGWRQAARRLWPYAIIVLVLVVVYAPLAVQHQASPDKTYRMEITPRVYIEGMYFYFSTMMYGRPWPFGRLIRWLVTLAVMAAALRWRPRPALLGAAGFVVFLGPVIFMARQREQLYLYIPASFLVLMLAAGAEAAGERLQSSAAGRELAAVVLMLFFVVTLPHLAHMQTRAKWMLEETAQARVDLEAFRSQVRTLHDNARIVMVGFPEGYNVFRTPGCSVLKVAYHVDPLNCTFSEDTSGADLVVTRRGKGIEVRQGLFPMTR